MIQIKEVVVSGFKGEYSTYKMDQSNLISGANGSGKSAVFAALQLGLAGRVEEIGSANHKLAALCDPNTNAAEATIKMTDGYEAQCSIRLKDEKATVVRKFMKDGIPLDLKAIEGAMFGGVPQRPKELSELTGEQMWSLLMPAELSVPPQSVIDVVAKINNKSLTDAIHNKDVGVATNEGMAICKSLISSAKEEVKRIAAIRSEAVPQYDGPPEHELDERMKYIRDKFSRNLESIRNKKRNTDEVNRLKEQIEHLNKQISTGSGIAQEFEKVKTTIESIRPLVQSLLATPEIDSSYGIIKSNLDLAKKACRAIASTGLFASSDFERFFYEVDGWIEDHPIESHPRMIAAASLADAMIEAKLDGILGTFTVDRMSLISKLVSDPASSQGVEQYYTNSKNNCDLVMQNTSALQEKVNTAQKRISELEAITEQILPQEEFEELDKTFKELEAHKEVLNSIRSIEKRQIDGATKTTEAESQIELIESAAAEIKGWRYTVIGNTLRIVQELASTFFPVQFELSSGKKSSVEILAKAKNSWRPLSSLSGAERVLTQYAVITAIQKFRNVNFPIVFVEGSELDPNSLRKLLEQTVKEPVNTFVAHYLREEVEGVNQVLVS